MAYAGTYGLQCGHGDDAVENLAAEVGSPPASLRFNAATAMTPGDLDVTLPRAQPRPRFNAATAMTPWRTTVSMFRSISRVSLQCGHGDDAVENVFPIGQLHL